MFVEGQLNYHDYVDRYEGEIRYADEGLGVLIDARWGSDASGVVCGVGGHATNDANERPGRSAPRRT